MSKVYLEEQQNKVKSTDGWTSTPTDVHYPSEKLVKNSLDLKANQDGYYESLSVGLADNLIDRKGDGSAQEFVFRTSCGSESITEDGSAEIKSLRGNTIVWNQRLQNPHFDSSSNWYGGGGTLDISNNVANLTYNSDQYNHYINQGLTKPTIAGHKYLFKGYIKGSSNLTALHSVKLSGTSTQEAFSFSSYELTTSFQEFSSIATITVACTYICIRGKDGSTYANEVFSVKDVMLIDLTQMFGAGNEPSTVAEFKALFPLDYYAYNAGELLSFNGTGVKTNGFNQWDEEWELGDIDETTGQNVASSSVIRSKNYIPVFPSTGYYIKVSTGTCPLYFYDAEKNYILPAFGAISGAFTTPSNARYMRFRCGTNYGTTYNNDICINLSWSGYRNGEYEAYWSETRNLPVSTYFSDGMKSAGSVYDELTKSKATKRIGKVDLGTLGWTYNPSYGSQGESMFTSSDFAMKNPRAFTDSSNCPNIRCAKYYTLNANVQFSTNSYGSVSAWASDTTTDTGRILIRDSNYTDATAFKTAMNGVYLCYVLATPTETTIDPPLNLAYKVADFGTEELLPENDDEPTTAPLNAVIAYTDDFTRMLATLPKNYDSTASLDALTTALATALGTALNGTFTITRGAYDSTNKKYAWTCTFTANS